MLWRRMSHPNILPLLGVTEDAFPDDSIPSIVTPRMDYNVKCYLESPINANAITRSDRLNLVSLDYDIHIMILSHIRVRAGKTSH